MKANFLSTPWIHKPTESWSNQWSVVLALCGWLWTLDTERTGAKLIAAMQEAEGQLTQGQGDGAQNGSEPRPHEVYNEFLNILKETFAYKPLAGLMADLRMVCTATPRMTRTDMYMFVVFQLVLSWQPATAAREETEQTLPC